ncbi:uncharacterized protein METZ01_LOCUS295158, partial [marine metagenome]
RRSVPLHPHPNVHECLRSAVHGIGGAGL